LASPQGQGVRYSEARLRHCLFCGNVCRETEENILQPFGDAIGYLQRYGVSQAARRFWQTYLFDRRRIYLNRYDMRAMAQLPVDTSGFEVRLAQPDDPIRESFPHLSPSTIATWLRPEHLLFLTVHRGQLVAYRCLSTRASVWVAPFVRRRPDQLHGIIIHVREDLRRHGLARITRILASRAAVARGFHWLLGTEQPTNHKALIANDRVGLTRLGTLTRTCVLGHVRFWATPASTLEPPLVSRQLTLLKRIAPAVSRVGLLVNPSVLLTSPEAEEATQRLAAAAGAELAVLPVREAVDQAGAFAAALATARDTGVNGLIVLSDPMMKAHHRALVTLIRRHRLPAIFDAPEFVAAGGLMSCQIPEPVLRDYDSLVAAYDMRHRSRHAQASANALDLAVNRSTAATLGLTVPSDLAVPGGTSA
jgi:hypothetical protein